MRNCWRPVRESNPCRRREREATCCNSMSLSGMDSTLPHLEGLRGIDIGRLMDVLLELASHLTLHSRQFLQPVFGQLNK